MNEIPMEEYAFQVEAIITKKLKAYQELEKKINNFIIGIIAMLSGIISVKATPANPAFTDDNFYKCVVYRYYYQKSYPHAPTNVDYSINLTQEQLEEIEQDFKVQKDHHHLYL